MADLGLYNFIKNSLAKGQTREQVVATLLAAGNTQAAIDDAFAAVESGAAPAFKSRVPEDTFRVFTPAEKHERQWEDFRNNFWKYALIFFGCALLTFTPLPLLNIFFVTCIGVTIAAFMVAEWNMTLAVRGKASVSFSLLSLFCFPLTYFLIYRRARASGWEIQIGQFELLLVTFSGLSVLAWLALLLLTLLSH